MNQTEGPPPELTPREGPVAAVLEVIRSLLCTMVCHLMANTVTSYVVDLAKV